MKETTYQEGQIQKIVVCKGNGTHGRRGDVEEVSPVILQHLIDTIIVSYKESRVLSCSIEVSGVLD